MKFTIRLIIYFLQQFCKIANLFLFNLKLYKSKERIEQEFVINRPIWPWRRPSPSSRCRSHFVAKNGDHPRFRQKDSYRLLWSIFGSLSIQGRTFLSRYPRGSRFTAPDSGLWKTDVEPCWYSLNQFLVVAIEREECASSVAKSNHRLMLFLFHYSKFRRKNLFHKHSKKNHKFDSFETFTVVVYRNVLDGAAKPLSNCPGMYCMSK